MTRHLAALTVLLLVATSVLADSGRFVRLFDGKTFDGWEGNLSTFRIRNGAVVAGSLEARIPHNEFLCTKKKYGDFELRLKAKIVGPGQNAGVQFRSKRLPNSSEVAGYQCDVGRHDGRSIWGCLYDEARRRKFLVYGDETEIAKVVKSDDWNDMVIRSEGPRVQIWINGLRTVDYTEADDAIPRQGIIGLQIHVGPPAEAWYKDIEIKEL
jgi:hypothetical protein